MLRRRLLPLFALLLIALPAAAQSSARLSFSNMALVTGEQATFEARIDCGAARCTVFQIRLRYDPRVIHIEHAALGGFLGEQVLVATYNVDNESGVFEFAAAALGSAAEPQDDLLFSLAITAAAVGRTQITVDSFEIGDLAAVEAGIRGGLILVAADAPTQAPTRTPTPLPTATEIASCPGTVPPRLVVGEWGQVSPGSPNNMRSTPSTSGTRIGQIPGNARFTVVDGPVCADGYTWWQIDYEGRVGWTAEGNHETYWLAPLGLSANAETMTTTAQAAYQEYERGTMIWLKSPDAVFVMLDDHTYALFDDLITDQARAPDMSMSPPLGRVAPVHGFSIIWRLYPEIRNAIGWGLHEEVGYTARIEYTSDGSTFIITKPDGATFVLTNGTWTGG